MDRHKFQKIITPVVISAIVTGVAIDTIKPGLLPPDNPSSNVILTSSGSSGSVFGIMGSWPKTELISTKRNNNQGYSHYQTLL